MTICPMLKSSCQWRFCLFSCCLTQKVHPGLQSWPSNWDLWCEYSSSDAFLWRDHVWFYNSIFPLSYVARVFPCCLLWNFISSIWVPHQQSSLCSLCAWVSRAEGRGLEQSNTENAASISHATVRDLTGWWGRKEQEILKNSCVLDIYEYVCGTGGLPETWSQDYSAWKRSLKPSAAFNPAPLSHIHH